MIIVELGSGLRPLPIVCVRDTKVRKFLGLDGFVEKVVQVVLIKVANVAAVVLVRKVQFIP